MFSGRTGAQIAVEAFERGHAVTLLTSHPEVVKDLRGGETSPSEGWAILTYRTFDDFQERMAEVIQPGGLDVVIHSAAVSDYRVEGVYAPAPETRFRPDGARWESSAAGPGLVDVGAGKVKSDAPELWLRLVRTPKLVDRVRSDWGFRGVLVKFKLEVGVSDERLLEVAEHSRRQSAADLLVANTLEGASTWAYVGPLAGRYQRVSRREMPGCLLEAVERLHQEKGHG